MPGTTPAEGPPRASNARPLLVAFASIWLAYAPASGAAQERPSPGALVPVEGQSEELAHPIDEAPEEPEEGQAQVSFLPGTGLRVRSSDGLFELHTRVRAQVLAALEVPQEGDPAVGFELRRARLVFAGHLFGEDNRYKLELAFSPRDLGFVDGAPTRSPMLDLYFDFNQLRDLRLRVGQYKLPFSRERVISSGDLQMVDRSIVNAEFSIDRDIGFDLHSRDLFGLGLLRYHLGISLGEGRDGFENEELGFLYLARIEFLPLGLFQDYAQADLSREARPRLSLGLAYAFLDEAEGVRGILGPAPEDGGTTDYHYVAADLFFMSHGFSVASELMWREGRRAPGALRDEMDRPLPVTAPRNGLGFFVQGGYLLPGVDLEISVRYGMNVPLGEAGSSSLTPCGELGAGLSYYFAGHPFKIQLDLFQLWESWESWDGFGEAFERGSQRLRIQLQASL